MHHQNRLLISTSLYALAMAFAPRAMAACPSGNTGNITSAGLCTSPQNLTGSTGNVVSGATLSTGSNPAYTISSSNATLTNSGIITSSIEETSAIASLEESGTGDVLLNAGTIDNTSSVVHGGVAVWLFNTEDSVTIAGGGLIESIGGQESKAFISEATSAFATPATALTGNFVNNGSIISSDTVLSFIGGSIAGSLINNGLIDHTGTLSSGYDIYDRYGVAGDLINSSTGTLLSLPTLGVEGIQAGYVGGNLINAGLIDVSGDGISAETGPSFGNATIAGNFLNSGTIFASVTESQASAGVLLGDVLGNVTNSGLIEAQDSGIIVNGSIGGDLENSGTIIGLAPYAGGFGGQTGLYVGGNVAGNVVNSGTIIAAYTGIYLDTELDSRSAGSSLANSVANSGLIEAKTGIESEDTFAGSFENLATGTIAASVTGIEAGSVLGNVSNAGTITGPSAIDIGFGGGGIIGGSFSNSGEIEAGAGGANYLFQATTLDGGFDNSGSMFGGTDFAAVAVPFIGGSIVNSGEVNAYDDPFYLIDPQFGSKYQTGTIGGGFTNTSTGVIAGGAFNDVYFDVMNGSFVNDGTLSGGEEAVTGQTIAGDFNNAGTISAENAVQIEGTITGNVINSGLISSDGADDTTVFPNPGFYLEGVGGSFANSGTIAGGASPAVQLNGTVAGGFTNTSMGTLTSTVQALLLKPGVGVFSLNNAGIISSTSSIPVYMDGCAAPDNCALNLTNSGMITGGSSPLIGVEVLSETAPSTITQTAGTISGAIDLPGSGLDDVIDIKGGQITGPIYDYLDGVLSGTVNFDLASGDAFTIQSGIGTDFNGIYANSVNIGSGTVVMNSRIDTNDGVVNDGVLQTGIFGTGSPVQAEIFGSYTQDAGGTLVEEVSPSQGQNSDLYVSGNVKLAGNLKLYFDPGTYNALSDTVVYAGAALTGSFSSVGLASGSATPGTFAVNPAAMTYSSDRAELTLSPPPPPPVSPPPPPPPPPVSPPPPPPPPPVSPPPPPPPPPVSPPPPPPPPPVSPPPPPPPPVSPPPPPPPPPVSPPPPPPVSPPPPPVSPPPPPVVLAPRNATIFPELATVAIIDAERSIDTLLSHAIAAPTSTGSTQLAFNDVSNPLGATHGGGEELAELGSIVPEVYAAYGAWIEASGNFADIRAGNGAPGYHAQTGGFLAGLARNITPEASLGLAVGYAHFNLSEDDTHASATDDTGRIALYGAYDFGPVTLSAAGGLGYDAFSTTRPLPVGTAKENHSGLEANLGLQLSQTLNLGALQLVPAAGFDYANLQEDSFAESGASGADLHGHAHGTSSLQPFIGVAAGQSFGLGGWSLTPLVHVTWRYEALNTQRSLIVAAQDGTLFNINGVSTARDQLDTGASLSASAGPNLQIYGAYDAQIGFGFGLDQSISAGVKYNF